MSDSTPSQNLTRRQALKHGAAGLGTIAGSFLIPSWVAPLRAWAEPMSGSLKDQLADAALAEAKRLGASYADIRINRYRHERLHTREHQLQSAHRSEDLGFGVRVLLDGAWGFAASPILTPEEARNSVKEAIGIAKANRRLLRKPIELVAVTKIVTEWKSSFKVDPFDIPMEKKLEKLLALNEAALQVKNISYVESDLVCVNEQKYLATSEGSRIEQYIIRTIPDFRVTAIAPGIKGFTTIDASREGRQIGYEYFDEIDWNARAKTTAERAVQKHSAPSVKPGTYDLILHPSHLWLTIHESVGHPTELDRALLWEANFAGTSFLTPDQTGKFQYGSKIVNFFADRTQDHAMATVGYDDEGVPAQKWDLIRDGVFVDWQTTRDLAKVVGRDQSYGCLHAESWAAVPFPRMPNVSLKPSPQKASLDDLVSGVEKGILIYGSGSFSIDQQRYNFQFGGQEFYEVQNGKIKGMLKDVAYQARTPDFWKACSRLGDQSTYELNGTFNDGKGEPVQLNAVSHGCPVALFNQINVLNTSSEI